MSPRHIVIFILQHMGISNERLLVQINPGGLTDNRAPRIGVTFVDILSSLGRKITFSPDIGH